jgi:hypothetical protein
MEKTYSYIIQVYEPEDAEWIDCEDGKFPYTAKTQQKKIDLAYERLQDWASSVPGVDIRLISREEELISSVSSDQEEEADESSE